MSKSIFFINQFIQSTPTNLKLFYTTKPIIIQFLLNSKSKQKLLSQNLLKLIPNNYIPNASKQHLLYNKLIQLNKLYSQTLPISKSKIQLASKHYLYNLATFINYQTT